MLALLLATTISTPQVYTAQHDVINRFCSFVVGVPYGTDNVTDEEWNRFTYCRQMLRYDEQN